jgi:hypothetical protein
LNFEAGAVAKKVGTAKVVPLLIDLPSTDLKGPLTAFQWRLLDETDVRRLLHDLNKAAGEQVPEKALDRLFDVTWQELKAAIDEAVDGAVAAQAKPERLVEDMLVEVVETVRRIERAGWVDPRIELLRILLESRYSTLLDAPELETLRKEILPPEPPDSSS